VSDDRDATLSDFETLFERILPSAIPFPLKTLLQFFCLRKLTGAFGYGGASDSACCSCGKYLREAFAELS
jgi:hypothetical protein